MAPQAPNERKAPVFLGAFRLSKAFWLPTGACSGRIKYGFIIDLQRARKRLRPESLGQPPITVALALADEIRSLLRTKGVNQSALARRFGLSRARVTQLLNLHRLHRDIQEFLRALRSVGPRYLTERRLRPISYLPHKEQLIELERLYPDFANARSDIKSMAG